MSASLVDPPTSSDDPRLRGWYHTIDLADGITSTGVYDLREVVDQHGVPASLEGKTVLDVGTADGFWAFEMERRGADSVTAVDIPNWGDFDWLPWIRESMGEAKQRASAKPRFDLVRAMRGSRVEHRFSSVYDLSPETVGTFDVVFCGSLILHLMNPIRALLSIRSVTREMAIIGTLADPEIEALAPYRPLASFGHRRSEKRLGEACIYWKFNTRGLQEIMEYCGFMRTEPLDPAPLPPTNAACAVVLGYP